MGNDTQIVFIKRNWLDRVTIRFRDWLERLSSSLITEYGIAMTLFCPHCSGEIKVSETMYFGKSYEFTCSECDRKFTVTIPQVIVRKGLVEEVIHGKSRD